MSDIGHEKTIYTSSIVMIGDVWWRVRIVRNHYWGVCELHEWRRDMGAWRPHDHWESFDVAVPGYGLPDVRAALPRSECELMDALRQTGGS